MKKWSAHKTKEFFFRIETELFDLSCELEKGAKTPEEGEVLLYVSNQANYFEHVKRGTSINRSLLNKQSKRGSRKITWIVNFLNPSTICRVWLSFPITTSYQELWEPKTEKQKKNLSRLTCIRWKNLQGGKFNGLLWSDDHFRDRWKNLISKGNFPCFWGNSIKQKTSQLNICRTLGCDHYVKYTGYVFALEANWKNIT